MSPEFARANNLRVGLIADTHMPGTIARLWPQIHDAFASVDCILHAGDLHVGGVIDELETLAPTFACIGNGDLDVEHPQLKAVWTGTLAGKPVALVHKFPTPRRASAEKLQQKLTRDFDDIDPQIVIYGHTHLAEVHCVGQRVYINPGSPTLPNNQSTRHGTIGFLEVGAKGVKVELHQIHEEGLTLLQTHRLQEHQPC